MKKVEKKARDHTSRFGVTVLTLCFILFCPVRSVAQTCMGKVLDGSSRKPVPVASVSLLQADSMVVSYTITDEAGAFSLSSPPGENASLIFFSCLGYAPRYIKLSSFRNGEVLLTPSAVALREVKVKPERIKLEGDTLTYAVSGFRLPQDRAIKDVLKRLPGIEVEDDGRIRYQGKAINKFYVEGMDLTGGKYNMISNNLSSKAVKDVQILENHQSIQALRSIDFSDQAALNLVLDEGAKSKLLGAVDIGAGYENHTQDVLWDNRLLVLLFFPENQNLTMYKNNNTGQDISEDLTLLTETTLQTMGFNREESDLFSPISSSANQLTAERSLFNETHLATTNHLHAFNKEATLRFQGSYTHDEESQYQESETVYYLPEEDVRIHENIQAGGKKDEIEGELTFTSNAANNYINNSFRVLVRFRQADGWISDTSNIQQETTLDRLNLSNEFELIHRYGNKTFRLSSINAFTRLPQEITVTPGLYEDFLNDGKPYDKMEQEARLRTFYSHSYTSFSHLLFGMNVEYRAGFKLKTQGLRSDLQTSGVKQPLSPLSDSLRNHFRYTETDLYLNPSVNYQSLKIKLKVGVDLSLKTTYRHNYLQDQAKKNATKLLVQPLINVEYSANALLRFNGTLTYNRDYSDIYSLYPGYIFTFYRSANANSNESSFRGSLNTALSLHYKNPLKGFFFNLTGQYGRVKENRLTAVDFNGILQQSRSIPIDVTNSSWRISTDLSQTLPFWSSSVKITYRYMNLENARILSDVLTHYKTTYHTGSFTYTARPIRQLNIDLKGNLTSSQIRQTAPEKSKYPSICNYTARLGIHYVPLTRLQFNLSNELFGSNTDEISLTYFADFDCSLLFGKSELRLSAKNIFDNHSYRLEDLGAMSYSREEYRLHGRQLEIKYLFNF